MAQQTAVEWLVEQFPQIDLGDPYNRNILQEAKQMEKEQAIDLIKQTAMFMGASNFDKEIASMTYEDVYNSYYNIKYKNK